MTGKYARKVLFVCTGNLCRSPLAEGMLRAQLAQAGLAERVLVDSAGIQTENGRPPEAFAIDVAAEHGADISRLTSRQFAPDDFAFFDVLIAMDLGHLDFLRATCPPGSRGEIRMLLDDVGDFKNVEVPDPYRQGRDAFEFSARLIDIGIKHLLTSIKTRLKVI